MTALLGSVAAVLAGAVATLVLLVRLKTEQAEHAATKALLEAVLHEREDAKVAVAKLERTIAARDRMLDEALEACRADDDPASLRDRLRRLLDPSWRNPAAAGQGSLPLGDSAS